MEALKGTPVHCGACSACCKKDMVKLESSDDPAAFKWHAEHGFKVLDRKPNGECIYLTARGCGIHDAAPSVCQRFDCRVLFLETPKARRRIRIEQNPTMRSVYDAGKRRLTLAQATSERG